MRVRERVVGGQTQTPLFVRLVNVLAISINSVETARLLLRVPELADAEALMGIIRDPEVVEPKRVTLLEPPGGLDLALKNTNDMVRQWQLRGYGTCRFVGLAPRSKASGVDPAGVDVRRAAMTNEGDSRLPLVGDALEPYRRFSRCHPVTASSRRCPGP
jgi:hypothetical protein